MEKFKEWLKNRNLEESIYVPDRNVAQNPATRAGYNVQSKSGLLNQVQQAIGSANQTQQSNTQQSNQANFISDKAPGPNWYKPGGPTRRSLPFTSQQAQQLAQSVDAKGEIFLYLDPQKYDVNHEVENRQQAMQPFGITVQTGNWPNGNIKMFKGIA